MDEKRKKNAIARENFRINAVVSSFIDGSLSTLEQFLQQAQEMLQKNPKCNVPIVAKTIEVLEGTHVDLMELYMNTIQKPIKKIAKDVIDGKTEDKPEEEHPTPELEIEEPETEELENNV